MTEWIEIFLAISAMIVWVGSAAGMWGRAMVMFVEDEPSWKWWLIAGIVDAAAFLAMLITVMRP